MNATTTPLPPETRAVKPAPKAPKASEITAPTVKVQTAPADPALVAELARLRAENEALKAEHAPRALSCKVSEKRALSVYGLGRFPVTLYKEQWDHLFANVEVVRAFRNAHDAELKSKGE